MTIDDLVTIDAAILAAVTTGKSVTFGGRSYTSHDLADLLELRASIARLVSTTNQSYRLFTYDKGA